MSVSSSPSHSGPVPAPAEMLQRLVRFDTTNPPGNEAGCISYIRDLLAEAGCESTILGKSPARPNLITRLSGEGSARPLLLYGHVDVVTTAGQIWQHPPFEGKLVDGYVWGRGALDMKGGIVMMLSAFLRAKAEGLSLPGDVTLVLVSDEEAGGDCGAKYLVEHHAGIFRDTKYAIGEFGGFSYQIGRQRFYPIMVAEKQICQLRATVRGQGGHGSLVHRDGAMGRLAKLLHNLERRRLPVHITPVARRMIREIGAHLPFPAGAALRGLLNPALTNRILKSMGGRGLTFDPLLRNTVNATMVHGGQQINVLPSEIVVDLDGRLLPGYSPEDLIDELGQVIGENVELEVVRHDAGPAEPDMGLFGQLASILRQADPTGAPIPVLMPGATDARFFSRLGIQTYGFLPMLLPNGFNFTQMIHGPDERIPVDALAFGTEAIFQLMQRFGEG